MSSESSSSSSGGESEGEGHSEAAAPPSLKDTHGSEHELSEEDNDMETMETTQEQQLQQPEDGEIMSPVKVKQEPELLTNRQQSRDGVIKRVVNGSSGSDTNYARQTSKNNRSDSAASTAQASSHDDESPMTPPPSRDHPFSTQQSRDNRKADPSANTPLVSDRNNAIIPQNDRDINTDSSATGLNKDSVDIYKDKAPNGEVLHDLLELQRQLAVLTNKQILKHVVSIVMEAEAGTVSKSTFDFDLCKLDSGTVKKIQTYISESVA